MLLATGPRWPACRGTPARNRSAPMRPTAAHGRLGRPCVVRAALTLVGADREWPPGATALVRPEFILYAGAAGVALLLTGGGL